MKNKLSKISEDLEKLFCRSVKPFQSEEFNLMWSVRVVNLQFLLPFFWIANDLKELWSMVVPFYDCFKITTYICISCRNKSKKWFYWTVLQHFLLSGCCFLLLLQHSLGKRKKYCVFKYFLAKFIIIVSFA